MKSRIIAVDLAKDVFEIAIANEQGRIVERHRFTRKAFSACLAAQPPALVLFEACGTAHFWGRTAQARGHQGRWLPAQYTAPYRRRGKTDRTDTEALLEAHRCDDIKPVPVRSVEQQMLQQLHRVREQWKHTRTQRINGLRGFLRELGFAMPLGTKVAQKPARHLIDDPAIPGPLKVVFSRMLDEIASLEADRVGVERQLKALTKTNADIQRLQTVAGVGLLTSTARVAAVGTPDRFPDGKHLSRWLGLTARENSSGNRRPLGKITQQGDVYLRTLLIQGARSVLTRSKTLLRAGRPLPRLYPWASALEQRVGHNKAAGALANKMARICWAVWSKHVDFNPNPVAA